MPSKNSEFSTYPKIIQEIGFDFSWDEEKVWQLDVPAERMAISELEWHFSIPFLWWNNEKYNLTPNQVMDNPVKFRKEYDRTMNADLSYPIDIMENKGRWLILDGLHRLMKASIMNQQEVMVRKIPRNMIEKILK